MVLLNIDRYVQVKYAVKAKTCWAPQRVIVYFLGVVIFAIVFTIPRIVNYAGLIENPEENLIRCYANFKISECYWLYALTTYRIGYCRYTEVAVIELMMVLVK